MMNTNELLGLIFLISVLVLPYLICLIFMIVCIVRAAVKREPNRIKHGLFLLASFLVVIASWITNFGWLRLAFFFVPAVHSVFMFLNVYHSVEFLKHSTMLKVYTVLNYATYILSYIFLPDAGDEYSHVFFGLIRSDSVIYDIIGPISFPLTGVAITLHITFMILLLVSTIITRSRTNSSLAEQVRSPENDPQTFE